MTYLEDHRRRLEWLMQIPFIGAYLGLFYLIIAKTKKGEPID